MTGFFDASITGAQTEMIPSKSGLEPKTTPPPSNYQNQPHLKSSQKKDSSAH